MYMYKFYYLVTALSSCVDRFWVISWCILHFRNDRKETVRSAHSLSSVSLLSLVWSQDRETGQRDHEGNGGAPHRGSLCAQRRLQVFCRPAGLHQSPEPEQRPLHPNDGGLHPPQELLCNTPPYFTLLLLRGSHLLPVSVSKKSREILNVF